MYYPCANGQEVFAQDKREVGCTRHAVCHMASLKDVGINSPRPTEQQHCAVLVESKLRGGWRTMLHGCRGRRKGRREKGRRPRLLMSPSYAFFCKLRLLGSTRAIKVLADLSHSFTANRKKCDRKPFRLQEST